MRLKGALFLFLFPVVLIAQEFTISGNVKDEKQQAISFVNVIVSKTPEVGESAVKFVKASITDEEGNFLIEALPKDSYSISFSYLGYENISETIEVNSNYQLGTTFLTPATETLDEAVVVAKKPTIKKTAGKLTFNVENTSLSVGNTFDLLKKTPGVIIIGDGISIKNQPTTVYLNNKRVYLSNSEIATFLQSLDANVIKSVEVITTPSSKYDAEASTVLNIITSKSISPGYKGSVNTTYEQATFAKYQLGTSHFYKNNKVNLYGSYSFSPRKENKDDDSFIRYFNEDGSTKSIWDGDFTRITRSRAHQANIIADITINERNSFSISANGLFSPNKDFENHQTNEIRNAQRQIDSTFITNSSLETDQSNLSFNAEYVATIGEKGTKTTAGFNYIKYKKDRIQDLNSDYFGPDNAFLRNNSFSTSAIQDTDIFIGKFDVETPIAKGNLETGVKYSNIDTTSGLDFFDTENNTMVFNQAFSDLFLYEESIFAGYVNYQKQYGKLNLSAGLRAEYTDVNGDSRSLGVVNTQNYFELFPTISTEYQFNEDHSVGITYKRAINRPRYQSLNPFSYFLNENNFNSGNPNLMPSLENKVTLSYNLKNKFFIDAYYQEIDNSLEVLNFQDNDTQTLRQLDANVISFYQYSLDFIYYTPLKDWLYFSAVTSTFYLENEFLALESVEETAVNNTFGFYAQMYGGLTLSKDQSFTSDVTLLYISNLISGSSEFNNVFNFSVSFRKSFWNKRASVSAGVDDIFNTNNVPVTTKYLNQDNSYFAQPESRLFRVSFKYNFGNFRLSDNNRTKKTDENDRLE